MNPGQPSGVQLGWGRGSCRGLGPESTVLGEARAAVEPPTQKGQGLDPSPGPASHLPPYAPHTCPVPQLSPRPVAPSQLTHCPSRNTQAALFI